MYTSHGSGGPAHASCLVTRQNTCIKCDLPLSVEILLCHIPDMPVGSPENLSSELSQSLVDEIDMYQVVWKGLTDTHCAVCEWVMNNNMVRHIHTKTECVTSDDANSNLSPWFQSKLVGNHTIMFSMSRATLRRSPGVLSRLELRTGMSYKLNQDVWPVPWYVLI